MYNRQVLSLNSCNIEGRKILSVTCGMSKCVIKSNFLSGGNTEKSENLDICELRNFQEEKICHWHLQKRVTQLTNELMPIKVS